ncbi:MAG: hypothetical protein MRY64_13670 [Hyphomonadaceae bacterium]|nr:hypothetical protein [Hyphomonadaceae bacterium]
MLFLFNDRVIELDLPETRLSQRWRTLGCGDPTVLRARDAVEFARAIVDQARRDEISLDENTILDIACLVVAKTGANAIQFVPRVSGPSEPRLSCIQTEALEAFRARAQGDAVQLTGAWSWSAA